MSIISLAAEWKRDLNILDTEATKKKEATVRNYFCYQNMPGKSNSLKLQKKIHIATKAQAQKQRNESQTSCVESKKEKLTCVWCQNCNDKQTSE